MGNTAKHRRLCAKDSSFGFEAKCVDEWFVAVRRSSVRGRRGITRALSCKIFAHCVHKSQHNRCNGIVGYVSPHVM